MLANCPECGKPISTKAWSCPNCGLPIRTTLWKMRGKIFVMDMNARYAAWKAENERRKAENERIRAEQSERYKEEQQNQMNQYSVNKPPESIYDTITGYVLIVAIFFVAIATVLFFNSLNQK